MNLEILKCALSDSVYHIMLSISLGQPNCMYKEGYSYIQFKFIFRKNTQLFDISEYAKVTKQTNKAKYKPRFNTSNS